MRKLLPLLILIPLFAAGPSGNVTVWKASDLKAKEKELVGKMSDKKMASEVLENYGNHNTMMAHREGDGEVEVHDKMADVFFMISGDATLIVGGTVVGGHPTTPGEIRGTSITGGEKKALGAGDVVHIPAKIPHQMMVANGKKVTYFVVKVEEKP
jgi:mannose-6-phosphate isomerase-like protein (cupin superfamily)